MSAPRLETGWGFPRDVSVDGHRIDELIAITTAMVAVLLLIAVVWMAWACLAHGRRHRAVPDHGNARRQALWACAVSALVFAIVDGNLLVSSFRDLAEAFWNFERAEADPDAVRVEINAHQWAWDVRHAGLDGRFNTADDVVTLNHLRVPQGRPVIVQLAAVDVLHALYLPNLRVKQDAIPGTITRTWFIAREPGDFDLACAEHCGANHHEMRGTLSVMPAAAWDRWLRAASERARASHDPGDREARWGWPWKRSLP